MEKQKSEKLLIDIIFELQKCGIDFLIAGGVAVVLHGVERLTMDLDLAVSLEKENVLKFIGVMEKLNLIPRLPVPATFLLDSDKIKMVVEQKNALVFTFIDPDVPLRQVDFFIAPGLSYAELVGDTVSFDLDGRKINVLSKQKIVELKLNISPMRDKDMFDIKELQRLINNEKK